MKKVAISACLTGKECRYDATDNFSAKLMARLDGYELVPFCPEDYAFGSPRPTMDLVQVEGEVKVISNKTGADLSVAVEGYAKQFFNTHTDIELFIGKDRSPSCGVCSAKVYDTEKKLLTEQAVGLMAKEAIARGITSVDAEEFRG